MKGWQSAKLVKLIIACYYSAKCIKLIIAFYYVGFLSKSDSEAIIGGFDQSRIIRVETHRDKRQSDFEPSSGTQGEYIIRESRQTSDDEAEIIRNLEDSSIIRGEEQIQFESEESILRNARRSVPDEDQTEEDYSSSSSIIRGSKNINKGK